MSRIKSILILGILAIIIVVTFAVAMLTRIFGYLILFVFAFILFGYFALKEIKKQLGGK